MKSLLDYSGEPSWSFKEVKEYWIKRKREETGLMYQWSTKDQSLLSRMMKEYDPNDLIKMIDGLLRVAPTTTLGGFFSTREAVYINVCKEKNYDWN